MCSIFQQVLEVLAAHQGHQELWNRSPFQPCAPVCLYHRHTITFCSGSDHKNCDQKNDGHTGSRCLDKAVLAQGAGGGGGGGDLNSSIPNENFSPAPVISCLFLMVHGPSDGPPPP